MLCQYQRVKKSVFIVSLSFHINSKSFKNGSEKRFVRGTDNPDNQLTVRVVKLLKDQNKDHLLYGKSMVQTPGYLKHTYKRFQSIMKKNIKWWSLTTLDFTQQKI